EATTLVADDTTARGDVFARDRSSGITPRVSVSTDGAQGKPTDDPWGGSTAGAISASGRYVVFESDAPNLVPGDTNGVDDVFLHDVKTGATTRVSVGSARRQADGPSRVLPNQPGRAHL